MGKFVNTREEALTLRRELRKQGQCACFLHTRSGHYYVSNCPLDWKELCMPQLTEKKEMKK